jgi:hypothetical protein
MLAFEQFGGFQLEARRAGKNSGAATFQFVFSDAGTVDVLTGLYRTIR